jgi:hypothetical protein
MLYVIEVPLVGDVDIRRIMETEHTSLSAADLEEFELWKHDGRRRFWAYTLTSDAIAKHGFSMKDQYSKDHGYHESDFVALGNGVFEDYEEGFENADAIIREFGSFLYFLPKHSWGSNGCQVLRPTCDLSAMIPPCFVSRIANKGLVALSVTSNVGAFLNGYVGYAKGHGGESVKALAYRLGLVNEH